MRKKNSFPPALRAGNAAGRKELKKSSMTRQRILDAAAAIFARKGYGRALMGEIAEAANIHITALYYHFNTKDDLAAGVINYVESMNLRDVVDAVKALPLDVGFYQKLRTAIHAQMEGIAARRDYALAQTKIFSEVPENYHEEYRVVLRKSASFWRRLLNDGLRAGFIRRGIDVSLARMLLLGSINSIIEANRPDGLSASEIAEQIADIMIGGIGVNARETSRIARIAAVN